MPKPKKNDRLPFKALSDEITVKHTKAHSLFQVVPDKPGKSAPIELCFDGTAGPNKTANAIHNAKTHAVQAGPVQPAKDANHVWYSVNHDCVLDDFREEAVRIIAENVLPPLIEAVTHFDYLEKPTELRFYPEAKSDRPKYLEFMKEAAILGGYEIKPLRVQVGGGTRKVDGFALTLKAA